MRLDSAPPSRGSAAILIPEAGKEIAMSRSLVETLLGAVVLAVAIGFIVFAYTRSGVATVSGYEVSAAFQPRGRHHQRFRCAHRRHQGRHGDRPRA